MKQKIALVALTVLGASSLRSHATNIGTILSDYSIITSGDLQDVSEYQGNAYVGGNVTDGSAFNTGISTYGGTPAGGASLNVAGNLNSGGPISVNSGNVIVGGSIQGGRILNMNGGGTITQGNPSALPSSPVAAVAAASSYWSTLSANSTAVASGGTLTFNCNGSSTLAVFNLSASQLFAQNQSFAINTGSSTKQILVNVTGTTANEAGGENFNGNWSSVAGELVFNFSQATTLSLSSQTFGYIVAPNAAVTANVTAINGGIDAASLNTSGEVHGPGTTPNYNLPDVVSSVPDGGATAALLGLSFTGIAVVRRKFPRA